MLPEHLTHTNSFNLHELPKRDIYCYHTHLTDEEMEDSLFYGEGQVCTAYRLINGGDHGATPGQLASALEAYKKLHLKHLVDTISCYLGNWGLELTQQRQDNKIVTQQKQQNPLS